MRPILLLFFFNLVSLDHFGQTAGSLDTGFGTGGKVTTAVGTVTCAYALAIQADGKIIACGNTITATNGDFAIVRYNTNGSLDNSFDTDGKVVTNFGSVNDNSCAVAIQNDGKIIVAGHGNPDPNKDFALIRLNADGTYDNSFDGDGKLTTDVSGGYDFGYTIALQTDGKILVAGASSWSYSVVRYNTNGSLDNSFDTDGKVSTNFGGTSYIKAIALQADGKIVAAGWAHNGSDWDIAIARYNVNGSLDNSFDGDGKLTVAVSTNDEDVANAVAIQADGKILVGGYYHSAGDYKMVMLRYLSNGVLDNTFDGDGIVTTTFGVDNDAINSIVLQPDGKILAAGSAYLGIGSAASDDFALVRYNTDGSLDNTFGGSGKIMTDWVGADERANAMALQTDGKIILAGYSDNGTDYVLAMARYISALDVGIIDFSFNKNPLLIYPNPVTDHSVLSYELANPENISIHLVDMHGHQIAAFTNHQYMGVGKHSQEINFPPDAAPGTYFVVIGTSNSQTSIKLVKH